VHIIFIIIITLDFIPAHEGFGTLQRLQEGDKSINFEISCLIGIMMQCKGLIANEFPGNPVDLVETRFREDAL
jgi:hypothetical protein